jgi:S1-C subfamily serine protease
MMGAAGSIGLGFAIPINNAKRSIDEFITDGKTRYGWLGVQLTDPGQEVLKAMGLDGKKGALAVNIFLNSPAYKGGIRAGDFITAVNGVDKSGMNAVTLAVGDLRAGDKAEFTLLRGGQEMKLTVTIEARNDEVAADNKKLWPGVFPAPLTDDIRKSLKLDSKVQGVLAGQVTAESPAVIVGLQRNDVITGVNGTPVRDLPAFYKALSDNAGKELWFEINRNGTNLETLRYKP